MLELKIPGLDKIQLHHLLLDCNGTLTCDTQLIAGVKPRIRTLARDLEITVLTADTHGNARTTLEPLGCALHVIRPQEQAEAKRAYIAKLGAEHCVAIGNGFNDNLMLREARLGIAVIQAEGAATSTLQHADVVCTDICAALDLLLKPQRLQATLRR
ncbi:MAG: HAD hydrolase family protein [Desulfuromonadaceae bacterium]|nr:HAD hydrolase family protein [Desulfuromonadaceae bacterium]